MYIRVYAPDGEPFDVTRERADTLILQKGWTQTASAPTPVFYAPVEVVEETVAEPEPAPEDEIADEEPAAPIKTRTRFKKSK